MPAPRKKTAAASGAAKKPKAKKPAPARKQTSKKATAAAPVTPSAPPKLVDLVREHLTSQGDPRSAAEIATALGQQHPGRTVKTTVVRTTLEGLVAKNQAQRTKQGTSVFYTAADTAPSTEDETQGPSV